jgi:hypothetical protein
MGNKALTPPAPDFVKGDKYLLPSGTETILISDKAYPKIVVDARKYPTFQEQEQENRDPTTPHLKAWNFDSDKKIWYKVLAKDYDAVLIQNSIIELGLTKALRTGGARKRKNRKTNRKKRTISRRSRIRG